MGGVPHDRVSGAVQSRRAKPGRRQPVQRRRAGNSGRLSRNWRACHAPCSDVAGPTPRRPADSVIVATNEDATDP